MSRRAFTLNHIIIIYNIYILLLIRGAVIPSRSIAIKKIVCKRNREQKNVRLAGEAINHSLVAMCKCKCKSFHLH